ncbi:hypothetical protein SELMODRAFT_424654 [Selaginella moellendorffii]|uniref:Uncharacterized protein n=1 Tax=Selaginella moellendorffii TaxID=88036 RepID=D8SQM0_SELML|nr:hypothetical protein SELMODRAFT_424654 [Selaginella moellendorffii]
MWTGSINRSSELSFLSQAASLKIYSGYCRIKGLQSYKKLLQTPGSSSPVCGSTPITLFSITSRSSDRRHSRKTQGSANVELDICTIQSQHVEPNGPMGPNWLYVMNGHHERADNSILDVSFYLAVLWGNFDQYLKDKVYFIDTVFP